jgi:REP element-mobilizing transposase RayT
MPWQNWYHCILTAYGHWLPGDQRGYRTRNHREHIEGDYKNPPPPSTFATNLHDHAESLMKFPPTRFNPNDRDPIGNLILQSLSIQKIPLAALAVCPTNIHLLLQPPTDRVKSILGKCKQNITRNYPPPEDHTWWAEDSAPKPINDSAHFTNARQYILDHKQKEAAWIWPPS